MVYIEKSYTVITGNAKEVLSTIPDKIIQTSITSPPYFGHRIYTPENENEIGTEVELNDYINHLVDVFSELYKKTRDDGTLWLNIGDTYRNNILLGVPWRVALALGEVGWQLRSDIIWYKPNAMPSSVKTRPTVDHEYIFFFAKNKVYFYNPDLIREPHVTFGEKSRMKGGRNHFGKRNGTPENGKNSGNPNLHTSRWDQAFHPLGRNKRTVWEIPLGKYRGVHFAVFPEKLVETCLVATSQEGSLVCDPFTGSGTTGVVAKKLGRYFYGIDLSEKYSQLAIGRINSTIVQGTLL
ncbi:MAG: site-specific DNA-methyltransferase [Armatimonadetes bacterium]|nr:site-specific DNA-methyltransferase [Armatimonadota bacterium]